MGEKKMNMDAIRDKMTAAFLGGKEYVQAQRDDYTEFSYPRFIKLMRFYTERYRVAGFGSFMTMRTRTAFGMELLTASFMPAEGVSVPFCLIDVMALGKKRVVFVEYYDCTAEKREMKRLKKTWQKFAGLADYTEKPHWYIKERTPYSLIKCGDRSTERELVKMILTSIRAYNAEIANAGKDPANIDGLVTFRSRMIDEGNPSSSVLEKAFGREGAAEFFKKCVMPL